MSWRGIVITSHQLIVIVIVIAIGVGATATMPSCSAYGEDPATGTKDPDASTSGGDGSPAAPGVCGDGKRSTDEVCDGVDLGEATCESSVGRGWVGKPSCTSACALDTKVCMVPTDTTVYTAQMNTPDAWKFFQTTLVHADAQRFRGGVFDGKHVYFVPYALAGKATGRAIQYDITSDFRSVGSWANFDTSSANGELKGFEAGAFDGKNVYFVPHDNDNPTGFLARFDIAKGFTATAAWSGFDVGNVDPTAKGFTGGVFDGRYLYLVASSIGVPHGVFARVDTKADFNVKESYTTFDLAKQNASAKGFKGGVFDGRYVYFAPNENQDKVASGVVARYDTTKKEFRAPTSWSTFDTAAKKDPNAKGFFGAVFDGSYVYFIPASGGVVARYDTKADFDATASWMIFDAATANPSSRGFRGGVFDGKYIYLVPYLNGSYHGVITRFDTTAPFESKAAWTVFDMTTLNPQAMGFYGAVFDGQYVYFVPSVGEIAVRYEAKKPAWVPAGWNASFL